MKEYEISPEKVKAFHEKIGKNAKRIHKEKGISQLKLSLAIGHKKVFRFNAEPDYFPSYKIHYGRGKR